MPSPVRRAAARLVSERRTSVVRRELAALASKPGPILAGPWLGEVGFELLYWIPFLRWFARDLRRSPERLIAVSRGGAAGAWYASFAGRSHDALSFIPPDEFKRQNFDRSGRLGEQKQIGADAARRRDRRFVRKAEGRDVSVLHPSIMYRLFAPYWWGHQAARMASARTRDSRDCSAAGAARRPSAGLYGREVLLQRLFHGHARRTAPSSSEPCGPARRRRDRSSRYRPASPLTITIPASPTSRRCRGSATC